MTKYGLHRYSQRLPWSSSLNAHSRLLEQKLQTGEALLDLTVSNPTQVFATYPHREIAAAYQTLADFTYHPDPSGEAEARSAVVSYYRARSIPLSPEQLLLTASTSEAYALLFKLLCDPGDEVLVPAPSYPLFEYLAALESVHAVTYRLRYDGGWFIDFADLRQNLSPRARAVILVNPNNPTGSFLKRHEAAELIELARERALPLISDEVFMDYSFDAAGDRVATLIGTDSTLTFSLNGLSKAAGMPQMKLAWIALGGPDTTREAARRHLELLADTYLSVSTPVQRALPELLRIGADFADEIARRVRRNLAALTAALANAPAHCLHSEGGWSAIVQLPRTLKEETWLMRLLEQHSVIAQPGYFFDMESEPYLILSLLTSPGIFDEGVRRLVTLIETAPDK